MAFAESLTDDEIERRFSELDGWTRRGDEISKTFGHAYHECVHVVAAEARGGSGITGTSTSGGSASGSESPRTMPGTGSRTRISRWPGTSTR